MFPHYCESANPFNNVLGTSAASYELEETPEKDTLCTLHEVWPEHVLEMSHAISGLENCAVKQALIDFCVSNKSILQCWTMFVSIESGDVDPIVNLILIQKP